MAKKKVKKPTKRQEIADEYEGIMFADGYDDCIIGVCTRFGQEPIVAYNYEKVIKKLMKDMNHEEALEFFDFNIIGAWVGDRTPCFIHTEMYS